MATWNGKRWVESKAEKAEGKARSLETLREACPKGATVYTMTVHRSSSRMMRVVKAFVVEDGEIRNITGCACDACGIKWNDKHYGAEFGGCGYSAENELVDSIAHALGLKGDKHASGWTDKPLKQRGL